MLIKTNSLKAFYGDFQALFGVDFEIDRGETVAVIGANGAGKTSLMRAISGVLATSAEAIVYQGRPIGALPAADIVARGIAMVPEGRKLFPSLTVEENLLIGAYGRPAKGHWNLQRIYELFPVLRERRRSPGTALSGGQQQMVAIGRALMSNPTLLLCDEISLGLAPVIVKDIYAVFPEIRAAGASIVIVEQDIGHALKVADRIYCMMEGRITLTANSDAVTRKDIHQAYFGAPSHEHD